MRVNGPSPGETEARRDALRARIARALRRHLRAAVDAALADHAAASAGLREALPELGAELGHLSQRVSGLRSHLERRRAPFTAEMTVHEAWARHRRVRLVFTRYHLPACDGCAVGLDETLEEAAMGHGIPLDDLLAELNALLRG